MPDFISSLRQRVYRLIPTYVYLGERLSILRLNNVFFALPIPVRPALVARQIKQKGMNSMQQNWHHISLEETYRLLDTSPQGLTGDEAAKRLLANGHNELTAGDKKSVFAIFFSQFKDFMIIILLIAALVSAFVAHEIVDSIVILILVIVNAVIGTVQEVKAEQSLEALQKMSAPRAKVLRDGKETVIPARELVPGDIVLLDTGDYVPADLRLVSTSSLQIQEAALTGESVPTEKKETLLPEDAPLGDRCNMAFSSSLLTYGRGRGVVAETGMNTEVGKIASMIASAPVVETPLQKRLAALGKTLGIAALVICAIMFLVGFLLYKREPLHMFMSAVALAVAAIPEGLPAISTIVLALGVQRMAKRNAIVRTLPSVETLGSATVICSDKTGTLTQNKMTVKQFVLPGFSAPEDIAKLQNTDLLYAAVLCNDTKETENGLVGDPTETALVAMGQKADVHKAALESRKPRVEELPFDSDRKRMTTVHQNEEGNGYTAYTKGGMDEILAICTTIRTHTGDRPITPEDKEALAALNQQMASTALRVLAFALRPWDKIPDDTKALENGLTFIGLTGMIDPPREEAKDAVAKCHTAGIIPVMITGDHKLTATAIATELDILRPDGRVITGSQLEDMSEEDLLKEVEHISVYARVSPEHKVRIVEAWQQHGHTVAMTGDGVNDAPALKHADIGCSMGEGGTDVAKDASNLILVDDNFATVVAAVEEGRRIYDNVLKAISFLLSCNIGEIITLFTATLLGWVEPLLPIHILLVNLVTDGLPALALGVDPPAKNIMQRKAQKQEGIFTWGFLWRMCYQGVMVGALTLCAFLIGRRYSTEIAQTMSFAVLALSQLTHSFNVRFKDQSIFKAPPFQNMKLVGAAALSLVIILCAMCIPGLNTVLGLTLLPASLTLEVIALSLAPVLIVELMKLLGMNTTKQEKEEAKSVID